jgi:serine/threonine-protein kinase
MGRVFRAYDETLKREVALKVLAEHHAQAPQFVERFGREARSVASLDHPNVVKVFDSGKDDGGSPYIAMELASGGTLKDRLRASGPLPPREAARLALQVAGALGAAHGAGIVHRDVKPENVLLTAEGDVKVADFGIARASEATAMTQTSLILGTAPYLSPEQAMGEPVGPASDLYSLGVVLYESLTGEPPFGTGAEMNPLAIAMKHLNEPAPSPRESQDGVPRPLEGITLALMRKRPEDRYPSAAALAADLEAFLDGRNPSRLAVPPNVPASGARTRILRRHSAPARRRRGLVPLMALAVASILVLSAAAPGLVQRPVVGLTTAPDARTLDRASSPELVAPPNAPEAPADEEDENPEGATAPKSAAANAQHTEPDATAPAASAAASTSPTPASSPAPFSASASPAPSESGSPAPAEPPLEQAPDASAPAEDPRAGPAPVLPPAALRRSPQVEVEVPDLEIPDH